MQLDELNRRTRMTQDVCACVGATILLLVTLGTAAAESKRVLMLHSFGRDFKPWSEYAKNIRGSWIGNHHGRWISQSIRS